MLVISAAAYLRLLFMSTLDWVLATYTVFNKMKIQKILQCVTMRFVLKIILILITCPHQRHLLSHYLNDTDFTSTFIQVVSIKYYLLSHYNLIWNQQKLPHNIVHIEIIHNILCGNRDHSSSYRKTNFHNVIKLPQYSLYPIHAEVKQTQVYPI